MPADHVARQLHHMISVRVISKLAALDQHYATKFNLSLVASSRK